jgi:hypothetical protein
MGRLTARKIETGARLGSLWVPDYSEHAYFLAVENAFKNWEAMQNVGR